MIIYVCTPQRKKLEELFQTHFVKSSAAICVVGSIRPEEEKQGVYGADC